MIRMETIDISELEKYVRIAFHGDDKLWEVYHNQDNNFEDTVVNNVKNINQISAEKKTQCYSVWLDNIAIGFSVIVEGFALYSFGINKTYRQQKGVVLSWFELIKDLMRDFIVLLCTENLRAIRFFQRNGLRTLFIQKNIIALILQQN